MADKTGFLMFLCYPTQR